MIFTIGLVLYFLGYAVMVWYEGDFSFNTISFVGLMMMSVSLCKFAWKNML